MEANYNLRAQEQNKYHIEMPRNKYKNMKANY